MGSIGAVRFAEITSKTNINDMIQKLPNYKGRRNEVKNPLYEENEVTYLATQELADRERRGLESVVTNEDIYVDRIISNQTYLEKDKLLRDAELTTPVPTIDVYKYMDTYIVSDGNHRAMIAKMRSQSKINANVVDLDKKPKKKRK